MTVVVTEEVGVDEERASPPKAMPLDGLKVLDLSRVLAGPWATMTLSDLGADVWKVENLDGGDDTRAWSVPSYNGVSTYFLAANRGKKSIAVDLKKAAGVDIILQLARQADIVIENFRSGVADRLGVGYKSLSGINPRIIYCSISGYGKSGPESDKPGYDFVMQAECGLMSITGEQDGDPMKMGVAITDIACGMIATQAILAALYQRNSTGVGQSIDISLFECALNLLANLGSAYLNTGDTPLRLGNAHPTVVPYQVFGTADGQFVLAVGNDKQFNALCKQVIGRPAIPGDLRFKTAGARAKNRSELIPLLASCFQGGTSSHWISACNAAGIPAGMVRSVAEAMASPSVAARNVVQTLHSPHMGPVSLVGPAHGMEAQRGRSYIAPPMLGQDTAEMLSKVLGYEPDRIRQLCQDGVIGLFPQGRRE
ncbi:CaiB/BaiF CoA transferase family protein [Mesorhizobium sp. ORM6]